MTTAANSWSQELVESAGERAPVKPLTVWKPSDFFAWEAPSGSNLLLPAFVSKGDLTTLVGQGGLGKSRLGGIWLPISQITGRDWCGIPTGGDPQKWMVLGNENGIGRIKIDLEKAFSNLTHEQRGLVDEYLRIQAICSCDEADLNLGSMETQARVEETLRQQEPGAVVLDPLNSFAAGDISKPAEMRDAIRSILSLVRRVVPTAAVILLHHARTGRNNIAQGVGYDAANFAAGGKTLYAMARCQMNLMPGSADDDTRLVLSCGKANNCERFETKGLIFDPESFLYRVDHDFKLEAWKREVEGLKGNSTPNCTINEVAEAVANGVTKRDALLEHLMRKYRHSKRTAERRIADAFGAGAIQSHGRGMYRVGLAVGGHSK